MYETLGIIFLEDEEVEVEVEGGVAFKINLKTYGGYGDYKNAIVINRYGDLVQFSQGSMALVGSKTKINGVTAKFEDCEHYIHDEIVIPKELYQILKIIQ